MSFIGTKVLRLTLLNRMETKDIYYFIIYNLQFYYHIF